VWCSGGGTPGGVPELVEDGVIECCIAGPEAMSQALENVIRNSKFRKSLAASARERARKEYSLKRQIDALLSLWSVILQPINSL
jgi:glycosyltransferase involved in cell wall biosynthesis